jgi:hypothetical protein
MMIPDVIPSYALVTVAEALKITSREPYRIRFVFVAVEPESSVVPLSL